MSEIIKFVRSDCGSEGLQLSRIKSGASIANLSWCLWCIAMCCQTQLSIFVGLKKGPKLPDIRVSNYILEIEGVFFSTNMSKGGLQILLCGFCPLRGGGYPQNP